MQFTRIPGPKLTASAWVRATIPPLVAEYASVFFSDIMALVEAVLIITPLVFSRYLAVYLAHRNVPVRFTPITRFHSFRDRSVIGLFIPIPALFMSTSISLNFLTAASMNCSTDLSEDTSHAE